MPDTTTRGRPARWSAVEAGPLPANIQALLDDAADRHSDRILWRSIDDDGDVLSYGAFRRLTVACAERLRGMGIGKGSHVALMLPNVPAFLIAWIALCRLGADGVMVNTASTPSELDRIVRQTDAAFLVIDGRFLETYLQLPPAARPVPAHVVVHRGDGPGGALPGAMDWSSLIATGERPGAFPEVALDDVAGILFTSGSSGVPKACMLSHRYWLTLGRSRAALGPAPASVLADTPMFYMGCLWKVLMAISCGAVVHVAPRLSLSRLVDRIVDNGVEFCTITAPAAALGADPRLARSPLKWITTYGLAKELHAGVERRFGVPVREIYGMTEVGSVLCMPVEDDSMVGSGSCGLPAPFRHCKLMRDGEEVLDGSPGELWVAGPGLFSCYYRDREATDAAFEGRWFRTGDLFRRDEGGYYYMLGRIKDVIRRGGENISAAEVELAVAAIDGVLEAAAVPVPDPLRGEEVKVVLARARSDAGARLTPRQVISACRESLSPFKVPRYVQFLDALPKTASAKVDKVSLRRDVSVMAGQTYDASRDDHEGD